MPRTGESVAIRLVAEPEDHVRRFRLPYAEGVGVLATGVYQIVSDACAHPAVAGSLGLLLGIALALVSRAASRLMTPDDPSRGFLKVALVALSRTLGTFSAMLMYFVIAPDGFLVFAVTIVITFILALAYEAFRASYSLSSVGSAGEGESSRVGVSHPA